MVRVLLFGRLRDVAGWREHTLELVGASLSTLRAELARLHPDLGHALAQPGVQVAVDKTLVRYDAPLRTGAEVAFLPPMSGG